MIAKRTISVGVVLAVTLATGCRTPPAEVREREAQAWERRMSDVAREVMERTRGRAWTLNDCQLIAREHALELTRARLAEHIAQARQWASFSTFLPQIEVQFQTLGMDEPPLRGFGEMTVALQDQNVRQTSLRIVQPLFAPEAWLLYGAARRGANAQRWARARAEQWLDVVVAERFAQCAMAEARLRAARRALEQAITAHRETESRRQNGRATEAEMAAADAAVAARQFELGQLERARQAARTRLLETMGLPPTLEPEIDVTSLTAGPPTPADAAEALLSRPMGEWLYEALRRRLDLRAADETVAARRIEILRAIALFLPRLYGFADHYTTSDSYVVHDEYWASGVQGVLSLFTGFRDVQAVRVARAEWQDAKTMRDLTAMTAMVQVIEARRSLSDAREQWNVARRAHAAARLAAAEAEAAYARGVAPASARDRARLALAEASAGVELAEVGLALAVRVFLDAVGQPLEGVEKS